MNTATMEYFLNVQQPDLLDEPFQPQLVDSVVRVRLSRRLTWAEREALVDMFDDVFGVSLTDFSYNPESDYPANIKVTAELYSRDVYALVAAVLENFVNVYPTAVKTVQERTA